MQRTSTSFLYDTRMGEMSNVRLHSTSSTICHTADGKPVCNPILLTLCVFVPWDLTLLPTITMTVPAQVRQWLSEHHQSKVSVLEGSFDLL